MSKFETCEFRSQESHEIVTSRCCGRVNSHQGWLCFHPDVATDVNETICDPCIYYKEKQIVEEEKGIFDDGEGKS